jgi:hypothetical protein
MQYSDGADVTANIRPPRHGMPLPHSTLQAHCNDDLRAGSRTAKYQVALILSTPSMACPALEVGANSFAHWHWQPQPPRHPWLTNSSINTTTYGLRRVVNPVVSHYLQNIAYGWACAQRSSRPPAASCSMCRREVAVKWLGALRLVGGHGAYGCGRRWEGIWHNSALSVNRYRS